jgi:trehalose-phosphatase
MTTEPGADAVELPDDLRVAVRQLARVPHLLVCSDYDGTLAPIVEDPTRARALPESISALRTLAGLSGTTAAVVSGRALRDLAALSRLPAEVHLVGSHGSEFDIGFVRALDGEASRRRTMVLGAVRGLVDGIPGVLLEEKPAGVAVHVRRATREDADAVLESLRQGPARSQGVYVTEGHEVLELSVVEGDKGHAVDVLRHQSGASAAIFVGDDVTDERAFARLTGPDVGVKVGPGSSAATHRVEGPRQVALLLALLAEERAAWLAGADATAIEDLTLLADGSTVALLTPDGDITWLCHPAPDSPAIFADLLGGPSAGVLSVHPARGGLPLGQEYLGDTLVARTRWAGLTVLDYLDRSPGPEPLGAPGPHVTRLVRVLSGRTAARVVFSPRPEFGGVPATLSISADEDDVPVGVAVEGASGLVFLRAPGVRWALHPDGAHTTAVATVDLSEGPVVLELRCGTTYTGPHPLSEAERRAATSAAWQDWADTLSVPPAHAAVVRRSALTLKALCHQRTGAVLAAATSSLPEGIGGIRNWDYRYCWVRDGAMTVRTLLDLGSTHEAEQFLGWLEQVLTETPGPQWLHPVYTLEGRPLGPEAVIEQLPGYAGSRPVRVGNAAQGQVQLDVFGPVADLVAALAERRGGGPGSVAEHEWRLVTQMVAAVDARWQEPDHGIWEIRDTPRHNVYSKVMCWFTVARALDVARQLGIRRPSWARLRDRIGADVLGAGWDEDVKAYVSAYGHSDLDAASLFIGLCGLLDDDDPRFAATVDAVEDVLRQGPTVFRYLHDDGLPGVEGGMHICTTWLVEAYLRVGRRDDAQALFASLLELAGPTGLLPEQYDPRHHRSLGNHPQAYSHLGVVRAALALAQPEP